MFNKKGILYTLSLTLIFPLFFISCSCKNSPLEGEVTFLTGTMKINDSYASVGSRVIKSDMLITGEKSEAVIQLGDAAVITLKPDTVMVFENLSDGSSGSGTASLLLNRGISLHKIIKSGSEYSVKSPTAVASVRGTEFEMSADETRTVIKVTSGTVYVRKISEHTRADKHITESQHKGVEEIILREGDSLQIYTLGAGAEGRSDRSISSVTSTEKSAEKLKETAAADKKDKTASAKLTGKSAERSETAAGKKQNIKKEKTSASGTKESGKITAAAKKRDTGKTAGTVSGSKKTGGTAKKDTGKKENNASNTDKTETVTGKTVKDKQKTAADNKNSSVSDKTSAKKTNKTTDSSSGKISKSNDIAAGKEKAPDPDAVRALVNKKDRNLNDIKKVYSRIDRVHLYSGKVITGAITGRGDTYTILTTEGIVKISKKDIQSNDIIK